MMTMECPAQLRALIDFRTPEVRPNGLPKARCLADCEHEQTCGPSGTQNLGSAPDRIYCARKLDQHTVSCRLEMGQRTLFIGAH